MTDRPIRKRPDRDTDGGCMADETAGAYRFERCWTWWLDTDDDPAADYWILAEVATRIPDEGRSLTSCESSSERAPEGRPHVPDVDNHADERVDRRERSPLGRLDGTSATRLREADRTPSGPRTRIDLGLLRDSGP